MMFVSTSATTARLEALNSTGSVTSVNSTKAENKMMPSQTMPVACVIKPSPNTTMPRFEPSMAGRTTAERNANGP